MLTQQPAVYILASQRNGTLYIGVTNELTARVGQHKDGCGSSFTTKYGVDQLVYFEFHPDMTTAIVREKQMKEWRRAWKLELIEEHNPQWRDLWFQLIEFG